MLNSKTQKKLLHLCQLLHNTQVIASRLQTQLPDDQTAAVIEQLSEESLLSEEAPALKKRKCSWKDKKHQYTKDGTVKKA